MEQKNQNLKLTSIHSTTKPSRLERNTKFYTNSGTRRDNVPGDRASCDSNNFQKSKKLKCSDVSNGKLDPEAKENLETSQNIYKIEKSPKRPEKSMKIKKELSKYRNELREFTNSTKDLEERYTKINSELSEMKEKHNYLITKRNLPCGDFDTFSDSSSTDEQYTLQRKCTQIFHRTNSFMQILSNEPLKEINYSSPNDNEKNRPIKENHKTKFRDRRSSQQSENKENLIPFSTTSSSYEDSSENMYKSVMDDQTKTQQNTAEVCTLKKTISKLQHDHKHYCTVIEQQKNTLSDYRSRFVKAQHLVKEQRFEIEQLNNKNQKLEKETSVIIDDLHRKIETKLKDVDQLSDKMKNEQSKKDFIIKENMCLNERVRKAEAEASELKAKIEDMSRRKVATITRLKVAERDLKIFKNYNIALKQEKRKLSEEMKVVTEQLEGMQSLSKRTMCRQREQTEKQRRNLQKRIFELELKLNRSQNSTTSLIQERDTLIAELQSQLNNLVHNFEVSQKHIRVLRRHIYSMCGNNNRQSIIHNRSLS